MCPSSWNGSKYMLLQPLLKSRRSIFLDHCEVLECTPVWYARKARFKSGICISVYCPVAVKEMSSRKAEARSLREVLENCTEGVRSGSYIRVGHFFKGCSLQVSGTVHCVLQGTLFSIFLLCRGRGQLGDSSLRRAFIVS